ncbi:insulinase family protein [Formosa sediminum]|uniref:Insulinase family protein n=1 Tax=Formosa sediminum TaxID=2594004 RepID=A0A516GQ39_9FLAO|nr:pitrilysin family protein [Formosa sediminum]QDO93480.1 insulinase family protein [Formosa sediminum]
MKTKISVLIVLFLMSVSVHAQIDRSKQPESGPAPKITLETPQEFTLKNGIKVLVVENHKLPKVTYSLRLDNKPITEGNKAGVSSLLSSMLGNGTTSISKDKFNDEIDFLGASLGFGAQNGYASSLSKYANRILELMADAAINPLFTEEEFQKSKDQLIEGLKSQEKSVDAIAARVGNALSYGKNNPFGEFTTEETVNNITLQDVKNFYNTYFIPNNAYLVVVGDVNYKTIKKDITKKFGAWKKGTEIKSATPPITSNVTTTQIDFIDVPNAVQSNVVVTNTVDLEKGDADYFAAKIANYILGGGGEGYLFKNLREQHAYTYGAYSSLNESRYNAGRFEASASVRNAVTDSAAVEILNEINRIKTQPVDVKDLESAKAKYVGNFVMALEKPETVAEYALNIKLNNLPKDFYETYLEKINALTPADIQNAAKTYFKPENARVIIVGKGSEVLTNLEKTGVPIAYYDKFANPVEKPTYDIALPEGVTAKTVLQDYINAVGGQEKLTAVNTINIISEAEYQPGMMMNLEIKKTAKNQFSQNITMMGQSVMKTVMNNKTGYVVMQGQKKEMTEEEVLKSVAEAAPFPELNYLTSTVSLEGIEDVEGEQAYKIKISEELSVFYSVESGLKLKDERTTPMGSAALFYSDYKDLNGIKFPYKLSQTMGPQKFDFIVKEIKVNEGVTNEDFN